MVPVFTVSKAERAEPGQGGGKNGRVQILETLQILDCGESKSTLEVEVKELGE